MQTQFDKEIRNDWTFEEIKQIFHQQLFDLLHQAATLHKKYQPSNKMKISTLVSIKTGACPEDCAYCAQSSKYQTHVEPHKVLELEDVKKLAQDAKNNGVGRVCLSSSWRKVPNNAEFDKLLQMIKCVKDMDLNVCCTLGMITVEQAKILAEAGITAYNHNVDTSEKYYSNIITTRKYQDRLDTLDNLIEAEVPFCSGGIIGLGESEDDRISMIQTLSTRKVHPYTLPLNVLVPIKGTPLENNKILPVWDMIRMIATARVILPKTIICLAAGRNTMTDEGQALCYYAGANSIFVGNKLLTTKNPAMDHDFELLNILGLEAFEKTSTPNNN